MTRLRSPYVTGATPGATYPWHVHEGKCSDANTPIFSDPSAYPSLVAGADGTASATAHIYKKLSEALNYIINVHASPTNMATIVACGDSTISQERWLAKPHASTHPREKDVTIRPENSVSDPVLRV